MITVETMMTYEQFLAEIEAHLVAAKMSPTGFGHAALGDPTFVFEMRKGRQASLTTINKVREYMAANPAKATAA